MCKTWERVQGATACVKVVFHLRGQLQEFPLTCVVHLLANLLPNEFQFVLQFQLLYLQ